MTKHIETVVYAAFTENGNILVWSQDHRLGSKVEPLVRLSDAQAAIAAAEERGMMKERATLQDISDEIAGLKLHPITSEEYDAGYIGGRNDAFAIVQGAIDNAD